MLAVVGLYIHIFRVRESERCEGESDIIGRQHVHGKCVCICVWVCGLKRADGVRGERFDWSPTQESGGCKGESDLIGRQSVGMRVAVERERERERGRKY